MRKALGFSVILILAAALFFTAFFSFVPEEQNSAYAYTASDEAYEIRSSSDLSDLIAFASDNSYYFDGKSILLYADVTAPQDRSSESLFSFFAGTFYGNGFSISGLKNMLFDTMLVGSEVRDLVLKDVNVSGKAVLARDNKGTIQNVDCYGNLTNGYLVSTNNGTISDVFLSVHAAYVQQSGILAQLNRKTIQNCSVSADVTVTPNDSAEDFTFGVLISASLGTSTVTAVVSDCVYTGTITLNGTRTTNTIYPFGLQQAYANTCGCSATLEVVATPAYTVDTSGTSTLSYYREVGQSPVVFDGSGTESNDLTNVSEKFYLPTGGYPVLKSLFSAEGTESDPFMLGSMSDVRKLVFCPSEVGADGFFAKLSNNIFDDGLGGVETPLVGTLIGNVANNGFVFSGISPFENASDVTATVSVVSGFGGDGYTGDPLTVASGESIRGEGTRSNPYLISSAFAMGALLADEDKNAVGKYAVVTKDIILNTVSGTHDYWWGEETVRLTLDGLGHTVANVFVSPFSAVEGTVKDLKILYSSHGFDSYGVCEEVKADGILSGITVGQTSEETFVNGICLTNHGRIEYCQNDLSGTTYAFCETNDGTIEDCASVEASAFASTTVGTNRCVRKGYRVINGEQRQGSSYAELYEDGFDLTNLFGYAVGGNETSPEIRRTGRTYRVPISQAVGIAEAEAVGVDSMPYETAGYVVSEIEESLLIEKDDEAIYTALFAWEYEGEPYTEATIGDVGTYTVTVTLSGSAYLTITATRTIKIVQTAFGESIVFADGDFANLVLTYTGEEITNEPVPSNISHLTAAGFELTYATTKKAGGAPAVLKNVGSYKQKVTATSKNYTSISLEREIAINKASLAVTVTDQSIEYGQEADFSAYDATACVCTPLGDDAGKSLKDLVEESGLVFSSYFTTDYVTGNDVADYTLGFSLAGTGNYTLVVTAGVLHVTPTDITGYVFDNKTYDYDGKAKSVEITSLPTGCNVVYEDNGQTNSGVYPVKGTVTHKNYKTLVVYATLTVEKAEITLTASNATKPYGYTFNADDFSYTHSATKNGEVFETVAEGITVTPYLEETGDLLVDTYVVKLLVEGEAQNYRFTTEDGTLTVEKVGLDVLYPKSSYENVETEYTGNNVSYAFSADAFGEEDVHISYTITNEKSEEKTEIINVGTYTVTAIVTPQNGTARNYNETTYTKRVKVTLIQTSIAFTQTSYTFTYTGDDYANETYAYDTDKIPDGAEIRFFFLKGDKKVEELIHAGTYTAVAQYDGNGNYADAEARATVTVSKRIARLTVGSEYDYTSEKIDPDIVISYDDGFEGTLTNDDLTLSYTDERGKTIHYIVAAGSYTLQISSNDPDYDFNQKTFDITVKPFAFVVPIEKIEFEYGTTGKTMYDDLSLEISGNRVTINDVYVQGTKEYVNVTFFLWGETWAVGEYALISEEGYVVTTGSIQQPTNYRFSFGNDLKAYVKERKLTVLWYDQTTKIDGYTYSVRYGGKDQNERFAYRLEGVAQGQTINDSAIEVSYKNLSEGSSGQSGVKINHAGTYTISLSLKNTPNYVLEKNTATLNVSVEKANLLAVTIADGMIKQREELLSSSLQISVDGLLGEDAGKSPRILKGFSFRMSTNYDANTASVGSSYNVTGKFTFADYNVPDGITNTAKYTVTEGYPEYRLSSKTFTYDGNPKSLLLQDMADGITVRYENNAQTDAGTYNVYAYVTYPTGRVSTSSAVLTIKKATPQVTCEDEYGAFTQSYTLTPEGLNATASVPGTFSITSGSLISAGQNTVKAVFLPTDKYNYATVQITKTITKYNVSDSTLVWTGDYSMGKDGKVYISEPLTVRFDKTAYPEIADKLDFLRNGEIVSTGMATIAKDALEVLEVRYNGTTLFTVRLDVVFKAKEEGEEDTIVIDTTMLVCNGISFSKDGTKFYMEGDTATISMNEKYREDFDLIINGVTIEGEFSLQKKDAENLIVIIYDKKLKEALYSKTAVIAEKTPENPTDQEIKKEGGFKTYYYYIIAGGAALLIVGAVLLILKMRK